MTRSLQRLFTLVLITASFTFTADERPFTLIEDASAHMAQERVAAIQEDKKLLWVLGSQWCHDSRSLQKKFKDETLSAILEESYRVSMIDVSYLNQGFEFTQSVGMQTFYATPTVLILDPETMTHLNADDMHIWSQAYTIEQEEALAYFKRYAEQTSLPQTHWNEDQTAALQRLMSYVKKQEMRIYNSYKVIGPLLKGYKDGTPDDTFEPYWDALASLRSELPKTIANNIELIKSVPDGQAIVLEIPEETPFPWEEAEE